MSQKNEAPSLEDVLSKLRQLKPYLHEQWGVMPLAVFGSVARGKATPQSDIDIMYDYDRPIGWDLCTVGDYLEAQFGRKVDLLSKQAVRPIVWEFIEEDMRYV